MKALSTLLLCLLTLTSYCQTDLAIKNPRLSNNSFSHSFGTLPPAQITNVLYIGGSVKNLGSVPATGVTLSVDVAGPTPLTFQFPLADIAAGDSIVHFVPQGVPDMAEGNYIASFSIAYDGSAQDADPSNDSTRHYFILDQYRWALDAIDATPEAERVLGSMGTRTFIDNDRITMMNYVDVRSPVAIHGFEALLSTDCLPGGKLAIAVIDSTQVLSSYGTLPPLNLNWSFQTDSVVIDADIIASGKVIVPFSQPLVLPPGGYFIGAYMHSELGYSQRFHFLDDLRSKENQFASHFYSYTDDRVWSNGNRLAMRLLLGDPPATCHAGFEVVQALDPDGTPIPFVLNVIDNSTTTAPPLTYQWNFGDGTTSTEAYPEHTYLTNGAYELCVQVTDLAGCTSTYCDSIGVDADGSLLRSEGFSIHVIPAGSTGMQDRPEPEHQAPWPNPTTNVLYLGNGNLPNGTPARVLDALGRTVLTTSLHNGALNTSGLAPGTYSVLCAGRTWRFVRATQ